MQQPLAMSSQSEFASFTNKSSSLPAAICIPEAAAAMACGISRGHEPYCCLCCLAKKSRNTAVIGEVSMPVVQVLLDCKSGDVQPQSRLQLVQLR